ncbi:MAG TPA: GNAT family N-acetyltransferase [Bacteroidota bacterium]|nr:GNAT family N-acetyltransferase [Bacteroidota bacterium]
MTTAYSDLIAPAPKEILHDTEPQRVEEDNGVLSLEIINDADEFKSHRVAWDLLVLRASSTVFQTFDWLYLWWQHFGRDANRSLHILMMRDNRAIVGIVPLFLETKTLFGFRVNKRLRLLGSGVKGRREYGVFDAYSPSDFLDAIIEPEYENRVVRTFLDYLRNHPTACDEVILENMPDESGFKKNLLLSIVGQDVSYSVQKADGCPRLSVPSSSQTFLAKLSGNTRRRLTQSRKALQNGHSIVETVGSYQEIEGFLNDLIRLHQDRWNNIGFPGVFSDSRFARFQHDVAHAFYLRGWLWLKTVRTDGYRIAARLAFIFKDNLYDYLAGFDDQSVSSKQKPGYGLLITMIDDAIRAGYTSIELLRGNEPYKYELTGEQGSVWTMRIWSFAETPSWRKVINSILSVVERISNRVHLEMLLMRTQYRVSRSPAWLVRYMKFSMDRLFKR